MALCVTGLGLLGLTILYVIFSGDLVWQYLSGFAGKDSAHACRVCGCRRLTHFVAAPPLRFVPPPPAGGSSIALFARVAGKRYTLTA